MTNKLVKDLMTSPAIYCDESTNIKEVIHILKENNIGFLPITKSNILVGVITDRDILTRGIGNYKLNSKISKIMTTGDLQYVNPDTTVLDAAKKMAEHKIRRLVVLDDGKITGVLTTKNLLPYPELFKYISKTYLDEKTIKEYSMYMNSNPHDSVKTADFPL